MPTSRINTPNPFIVLPPLDPPPPEHDPRARIRIELLLAALIALVASGVVFWHSLDRSRQGVLAAILLFCVGFGLFALAGTVEQWCAPAHANFGGVVWGQHDFQQLRFIDCLRW